MNKSDVIEFFDRCAPFWDEEMVRNETVIAEILDCGGIRPGRDVLDVACGTGVLFPVFEFCRRIHPACPTDPPPLFRDNGR